MPASRSLIALLLGTIVFFALWLVALKPGSSSSGSGGGSSNQGLGAYQSDINKAKQAVGVSNASNAASGRLSGGSSATAPAAPAAAGRPSSATPTGSAKPTTTSASTARPAATARAGAGVSGAGASTAGQLSTVRAALSAHRVVAMLFYNPGGADDQAVRQELASVPTHHGQVVKLAIPLSQAANFTAVTEQVPVNFSPTLVLIDRHGQASEILGYSDSFEINQRVDDALAVG